MGNCCPKKMKNEENTNNKELLGENDTTADTEITLRLVSDLSVHMHDVPEPKRAFSISNAFPKYAIERLQEQFSQELAAFKLEEKPLRTVEHGNFWSCQIYVASLPKENSSELYTITRERFRTNFRAELIVFALLNQVVQLNSSVDETELIDISVTDSMILIVERIKTKRILVVAPRHMLYVRVIKRVDENTWVDLAQTIDANLLVNDLTLAPMYEKIKDSFASVLISGKLITNRDGYCEIETISKTDFRSSVSLKISSPFISKQFEGYVKSLQDNCDKLLNDKCAEKLTSCYWLPPHFTLERPSKGLPEFLNGQNSATLCANLNHAKEKANANEPRI